MLSFADTFLTILKLKSPEKRPEESGDKKLSSGCHKLCEIPDISPNNNLRSRLNSFVPLLHFVNSTAVWNSLQTLNAATTTTKKKSDKFYLHSYLRAQQSECLCPRTRTPGWETPSSSAWNNNKDLINYHTEQHCFVCLDTPKHPDTQTCPRLFIICDTPTAPLYPLPGHTLYNSTHHPHTLLRLVHSVFLLVVHDFWLAAEVA